MEVLKLPTVNLDALGAIQNAYGGREAFNVHSRGGGDSHMKQTGMLVGNFEFNP